MTQTIIFPDGRQTPALGLGTWHMGDTPHTRAQEIRALQCGIDLGMTVIDTAEMYGSGRAENLVGEAILGRRDEVFLVSKVLPCNATGARLRDACEQSLQRLRTDRLDLYLLHWRGEHPFADTVNGMRHLMAEGKIRAWGVSNMDVEDMRAIFAVKGGDHCAANQVLYNLARRGVEYDLLPWQQRKNMPLMAYSPLEQARILDNPTLRTVAGRHGTTPAQVALAWVLRAAGVLAIPKAASEQHVRTNAASRDITLTDEDLHALDVAFAPPRHKIELEIL